MHEEMLCIHKVLKIIYLQWATNDSYCIGVGISGKTNDDMDLAEYVADADGMWPTTLWRKG